MSQPPFGVAQRGIAGAQLTADANVQLSMKRVGLVLIPLAIIFLSFLLVHREPVLPVVSPPPNRVSVTATFGMREDGKSFQARLREIIARPDRAGSIAIFGETRLVPNGINAPPSQPYPALEAPATVH